MSEIVNVTVIFPEPIIHTLIVEKIGPQGPAGGAGEGGGGGVTDHGALTGLNDDDHPQYLTEGRGDARYDAIGTAAAAQNAHTAASDPHPQYPLTSEMTAAIDAAINQLIDGSPSALNTLLELAGAMGNDPNFAATVTNALASKVDKITGKGLSTEDFTSALLAKLNGVAANATANATDAALRARSSHTGTQLASTISDFAAAVSSVKPGGFGFNVDGGLSGSLITTGKKGVLVMPRAGTITGWSIVAEGTNPTATIDIWKIASGTTLPTILNSITAAAKPALATGNALRSTTLTSWTINFSAGDIFIFNLDAVANATRLTFTLETT